MSKWMYTCKDVTMLLSKKEEARLSLPQMIKLRMHLAMCRFCKMFEKQNASMVRYLRDAGFNTPPMSEDRKKKIQEELNR